MHRDNSTRTQRPKRPMHICKHCGAAAVRRSHARWYEAMLKLVTTQRPYRCGACRRRVWFESDHAIDSDYAPANERAPVMAELPDPPDLALLDETTTASGQGAYHDWQLPLAALDAGETFEPSHN